MIMITQTLEVKDIYRYACYHSRPFVYLRSLRIYGRRNKQLVANSMFVEKGTQIKSECAGCNKNLFD